MAMASLRRTRSLFSLALLMAMAASRAVAQTPGCAVPLFAATPSVTMLGHHTDIVLADLNEDGFPDLVVAEDDPNFGATQFYVGVRHGAAGRNFGAEQRFPVGARPQELITADFDADGHQDVAVACSDGMEIWVLFGDGSGGLPTTTVIPVADAVLALVVADFNGDGYPDIAAPTYGSAFTGSTMEILRGDGLGGFIVSSSPMTGFAHTAIAAGDVNGDGFVDLVTTSRVSDDVSIHLGTGTGTFSLSASHVVTPDPEAVRLGDVDHDGDLDLVVASWWTSGTVSVRFNDGSGGFAAFSALNAGGGSAGVEIVDVDADGNVDLLVANEADDNVSLMRGDGSGGFAAPENFPALESPRRIAVGDLDLDGRPDLAVANGWGDSVALLWGSAGGPSSSQLRVPMGLTPSEIGSVDMDGDGRRDLVASIYDGVAIRLNTGSGFAPPIILGTSLPGRHFATGDANGDGLPDVAVVGRYGVFIHHSNGSGGYLAPVIEAFPDEPVEALFGDWDGDGNGDWVVASSGFDGSNGPYIPRITLLRGDGAGGYLRSSFVPLHEPHGLASLDWDGDGNLDLAMTTAATASVLVHLGDGLGGFPNLVTLPLLGFGGAPVAGDVDRDGNDDLVVPCSYAAEVRILRGDGQGALLSTQGFPHVGLPIEVALGDLTHDGHPDLAVLSAGSNQRLTLSMGDGLGGFVPEAPLPHPFDPRDVDIEDVNGDGNPDLLIANRISDDLSLHYNLCSALALGIHQPGAGAPLTFKDHNLVPGEEVYNIFSLDVCPGPPGSGPAGLHGLCITTPSNLQFVSDQITAPLGFHPFHFQAASTQASFGPFPTTGITGLSFDALAVTLQGGLISRVSAVQRHTVR